MTRPLLWASGGVSNDLVRDLGNRLVFPSDQNDASYANRIGGKRRLLALSMRQNNVFIPVFRYDDCSVSSN